MKTLSKCRRREKEGGALVLATLVVLTFSVLQIGLFKLRETVAVETVHVEHHKQAFWLAESGLDDAILLLQYGKDFRDGISQDPANPTILPSIAVSEVGGTYEVSVYRTPLSPLVLGIYDYEILSVGNVKGATRTLRRTVRSYPGAKYAIIGTSGITSLSANVVVNGPIAQIQGDVYVHDSRNLGDYLIIGDGTLIDRKGEAIVANFPPPPPPTIDTSRYADLLASLASEPATTNLVLGSASELTLSGVVKYNHTGVLTFDGKTKIADGTVLVVKEGVRFNKSGVQIGSNVTIVSGDNISFKVQAAVGAGSEIYAVGNIYFESGSSLNTGDEAVLLMAKNGNIEMDSNFDFRGIMIAENGSVELNSGGTIEGTIIGGVGIDASANIKINYDPSVFSEVTPVVPKSFGDVVVTVGAWREVPSL